MAGAIAADLYCSWLSAHCMQMAQRAGDARRREDFGENSDGLCGSESARAKSA